MRKILSLFFVTITVLMLAGCGSDQETVGTTESSVFTESMEASNEEEGSAVKNTETEVIGSEDTEETEPYDTGEDIQEGDTMLLTVNGTSLTALMEDNSSVAALMELLAEGPLTIEMSDYANMEKVGSIGTDLPRNDEQITTSACDLILYQGNSFVIYYAPNSWDFTRLGRIQNMTADELKELLGDGDVTVTLSLPDQQ
ncbi:MAG: hypothetical protein LIP11_01560 [Clostridiales bacterium]|nr:hypothetical protein [Clostridiales bacterium]